MARHSIVRDYAHEQRLFLGRVWFASFLIALGFLGLITRFVYLQLIQHEHFVTRSDANRVRIEPVPPARGLVLDRNGVVLAENRPSFRLELTKEQINDMDRTLRELRTLLDISDSDIKQFLEAQHSRRHFDPIPLKFQMSEREVARFAVNRHRFPGVNAVAYLSRHYPLGSQTAHVIGYVGRIDGADLRRIDETQYRGTSHIGKTGIERFYEDHLHGEVGFRQVETNAQGRVLKELEETPPVRGNDLHLTLDIGLQIAAEEALGELAGAVVALDPANGDVLALVSMPSYDPHLFVHGISNQDYQALRTGRDKPLFNRALYGQYPPGSTIKPFIALAGLTEGITNHEHTVWCPGYFQLPGKERRYRDWKREGHGRMNITDSITQSCDVYFYWLAWKLGIDPLHDYLTNFGFGEPTNIDLNGEEPGLLPSSEWKRTARGEAWFPGETVITGVGQGFILVTPLQLAVTTATLANPGQRIRPRLLRDVERPDDTLVPEPSRVTPIEIPMREGDWQAVIDAMVDVVHTPRGTAQAAAVETRYEVAGKTGTAQVIGIEEDEEYVEEEVAEHLRDHALFVGFAPPDDPLIVIAVVAENAGSGGRIAAPIAVRIMDRYLSSRGL